MVMNRWFGMIVAFAAVAALGGCKNKRVESITFQTGPCFGTCPVYTVTVHSNGQGLFTGQAHTTVTGPQAFTVTDPISGLRQSSRANSPGDRHCAL